MSDMQVFDIETGPETEERLRELLPEFDADKAVPVLGEFDESTVKLGNAKKAELVAAKIEEARELHWQSQMQRPQKIEEAREQHWSKFIEKAALSPVTGRVLAIGYYAPPAFELIQSCVDISRERSLIENFWQQSSPAFRQVGHNIHGFDLPFLYRRSIILGIDIPEWVRDYRGYWHGSFIDTMKVWGFPTLHNPLDDKLGTIARILGAGSKTNGVTGADFARLFWGTDQEQEQALDYLRNDLQLTWAVADALQIV